MVMASSITASPLHDVDRLSAVIDLDAIVQNWRILERFANNTPAMPVLKADAYGHGMLPVAKALYQNGCRSAFTASIDEAVAIACVLPEMTIAYFDGPCRDDEDLILTHKIIPVINSLEQMACLADIGRRHNMKPQAMLHIDTGMNRLGLSPAEVEQLAHNPDLAQIDWQVVMSHLAMADIPSDPMNSCQKAAFDQFLASCPAPLKSAKASLSATAGIMLGDGYHYDLTRPGIGLYGMAPAPDVAPEKTRDLIPTITLSGRVLQIRMVPAGCSVGYGQSHITTGDCRLATIGGGYADGIPRQLSNTAAWMKDGHIAPVVGRVSMDVHVVDITSWPESALMVGDSLEFISNSADIHEIAKKTGTIAHDVLTRLGLRAKRHYAGDIVKQLDL